MQQQRPCCLIAPVCSSKTKLSAAIHSKQPCNVIVAAAACVWPYWLGKPFPPTPTAAQNLKKKKKQTEKKRWGEGIFPHKAASQQPASPLGCSQLTPSTNCSAWPSWRCHHWKGTRGGDKGLWKGGACGTPCAAPSQGRELSSSRKPSMGPAYPLTCKQYDGVGELLLGIFPSDHF